MLEGIYLSSFPPEERRDWQDVIRRNGKDLNILTIQSEQSCEPTGLLTYWLFDDFVYIEHFAVAASSRGAGVGSKALQAFITASKVPVLLEVEPPETDDAVRRIAFYSRHGLDVISTGYIQPPYMPGLPSVPLFLMSNGALDTKMAAQKLHCHVYGVMDGGVR